MPVRQDFHKFSLKMLNIHVKLNDSNPPIRSNNHQKLISVNSLNFCLIVPFFELIKINNACLVSCTFINLSNHSLT